MNEPLIPPGSDGPSPALVNAIRRLLRPLVKLLIGRGIGFPFMAEMLKGLYVEVADQHFTLSNKPQTDSRISLLTGLHRKDVKRLRAETAAPIRTKAAPLTAQLIAHWTGDSRYHLTPGKPVPLERLAKNNPNQSFEQLVTEVNKDIRPRAVLDEWLRQGIARLDKDDQVHLLIDAFIPQAGLDEKFYYFGRNLHDHVATGVNNLLGEHPPLLERNVYYDRLTPASVDALTKLAREQGMQALQTVNAAALDLQEQDNGKSAAGRRMSFGVYFYTPIHDATDESDV